ncbi:hypothetical protein ACLB2K_020592 [Fragaria x ananassa]
MKKWADKKRRHVEFKEGDFVLVKLLPQQFKSLRKVHKGLVCKYEWPFEVIKRIDKVSYKLHLPPKLKIHPVFHVSMLKPFQEDEEDPSRGVSHRTPTTVVTSFNKEVDEILANRVIRHRGVSSYKEYLIKWRGMLNTEANWESDDILWQFKDKIQHYNEIPTRPSVRLCARSERNSSRVFLVRGADSSSRAVVLLRTPQFARADSTRPSASLEADSSSPECKPFGEERTLQLARVSPILCEADSLARPSFSPFVRSGPFSSLVRRGPLSSPGSVSLSLGGGPVQYIS